MILVLLYTEFVILGTVYFAFVIYVLSENGLDEADSNVNWKWSCHFRTYTLGISTKPTLFVLCPISYFYHGLVTGTRTDKEKNRYEYI